MTRRDWLAAAGLTLTGCGGRQQRGFPGAALVAVSGENSLAVVDLIAFRLRDSIPLDAAPARVLHRSKDDLSYVLTPETGSVHIIDSALRRARTGKLADKLSEIQFGPAGDLFGLSSHSNEIVTAEARTLAVRQRIQLRASPSGMHVSSTGDIGVALGSQQSVVFIGRDGRQRTVALEGQPEQVRFRADGELLIVTRPTDRVLTVLSVPELHILAHLPLAMEPRNLCFTPDGGQLFITGPGMDGLAIVFPYNTLEVEQTILAGRNPGCMACAEQPPYLFVANKTSSAVSILQVPNRKMIALVEVGLQPAFITVTPDNQYALVLDEGSGDMAVVRIPSIRVNRAKSGALLFRSGASLFTLLPVGSRPVHAAVVRYLTV